MGPTRRVRRARSRRGRRLPLPPRTDPRRRLRGALVPAEARAPRPSGRGHRASSRASAPRRPPSSSHCTTSTPVAGRERGRTRASRAISHVRSTRTSTPRGSTSARSRRAGRSTTSRTTSSRAPGARSARSRDAAGDYRGAIDALRSATTLLKHDPVAQAELYEERAFAWARLGSYSTALREITAGLKRIESVSTLEAKHAANSLLALRAYIHLQQGRPRDAIAIASKVVADAEPLGPSVALARAYSALEGGYLFIGEPEKAVYEEKALEMFRSLGAARSAAVIESNLGVKAYAQGTWGEAESYTRTRARSSSVWGTSPRRPTRRQPRRGVGGPRYVSRGRRSVDRCSRHAARLGVPLRRNLLRDPARTTGYCNRRPVGRSQRSHESSGRGPLDRGRRPVRRGVDAPRGCHHSHR